VGPLYFRIEQEDEGSRRFGYIPEMARCRIGSLNSEGFCERMLRAAGHVLTEGNSLLKSSELEKLTLLRMNKDFMKFMRANYSHVSRQQFNRTVAERERARERDPVTGDVASGGSRARDGAWGCEGCAKACARMR